MSRGLIPLLQRIHDDFAAAEGNLIFARVHGGNAVEAHRREADQFHHGGHGIGGELAAACARAGTCHVFDRQQFGVAHLAGGVGADGFEHVLNRDVSALVIARGDRAAVEHQAGKIQASSAMAAAGIVLSQPTMQTMASNIWPRQTSSMESAITSRLTSEAFMPSVPMVTPSLMAMVLNSMGVPPAARMPSFTLAESRAG